MGLSLAWIAARGLPFEAVLDRLRLEATGESADYVEHALTGCSLPGGWSVVVAHGCDHRIVDDKELALLSRDCELIACSVEEHAMYSRAQRWAAGRKVWSVSHDAQASFDHLSAEGDLPAEFDAVRTRHAEQQQAEGGRSAGVDLYFEIPLVLAQTTVGFKHDEGASPEPEAGFQAILDRAVTSRGPSGKTWWRFWR